MSGFKQRLKDMRFLALLRFVSTLKELLHIRSIMYVR